MEPSGMSNRPKSTIKSVGSVIDGLTQSLGIHQKLQEYEAVAQWDSIVGQKIAAMSVASKIVRGVLFVKVRTSTWRNELNIRKKEIITKMNQTIGEEVVKDIKFQ